MTVPMFVSYSSLLQRTVKSFDTVDRFSSLIVEGLDS